MRIGFIGLGIMGKPMAKNLLKGGHEVTVFNRSRPAMDDCVAAGARAADSPADAAARSEVVITMLPNSPDVKSVATGDGGILAGAQKGLVYIDMSSIAPLAAREVAEACAARGVAMLDAPVSGGEAGAVNGTLAVMAGGEKAVFDRVRDDVLLKMAASAVYCGGIGAGNTTKLANQVIVAANIAAIAEAFTLAKKSGVEPGLVLNAIKGGLAGSAALNMKAPMMMDNNFKPGFKVELHIKDLANALDTGHSVGSPLPLAAQVMEMLQVLRADGGGQEDHSALARYYAKLSGTAIGE